MEFTESHQRCCILKCECFHVVFVNICQQVVELLGVFSLFSRLDIGGGKLIRIVGTEFNKYNHK